MSFIKAALKWLKFAAIAAISLLTLIVFWYLWTQHIEDAHYKSIDTGIWPSTNAYHPPVWLDNDRILILSTDNHKPGKNPQLYVMYNVTTKQISHTHLVGRIQCDRDGQFIYRTSDPADDRVYRGNLNHSEPYFKPDGDWMMDVHFDCEWVPKETSTAGKINYVYPYFIKLRGKNYLEIFRSGKRLYHEHLGDAGVPYPLGDTTTYSEYLDAYINSSNDYDPAKPENTRFWTIKRNGQIVETPYPHNMFISDKRPGDHNIFPIKPGYLIHYHGAGFDDQVNGLYLVSNGSLKHVLSGFIEYISVSPNGCLATFDYSKNVKEAVATSKDGNVVAMPKTTVRFIDFCSGDFK